MNATRFVPGSFLLAAVLMAACGGGNGTAADVPVGDVVPTQDHAVDPGTIDEDIPAPPRDVPATDLPGADEPVTPDVPATPDPGVEDPGPQEDAGFDPDAVAYSQCARDNQCPEGLVCDMPFPDAKYGFCSRQCNNNAECPASSLAIPAGCYKNDGATLGWCSSWCGANNGGSQTCEDWLKCMGEAFCLPPSTTIPTKGPGQLCTGGAECLSDQCVEGQNTRAHCALLCDTDADCAGPDDLWKGVCTPAGTASWKFCLFMCGMMGAGKVCPGELACQGMSVCQ